MINWNVSPDFSIGPVTLHWYGLLFAGAFLIAYEIMRVTFRTAKVGASLDGLLLAVMLGTIVGARLGHTLLYEPNIYLRDPVRILKVWEGGLASHGGVAGVFIALWIYCRINHMSWIWLMDRIMIPSAIGAAMVRIGNLFNSEILGKPTTLPWAFVFKRVDNVPRHPAQLYECFYCLLLTGVLTWLYRRKNAGAYPGRMTGVFLVSIFVCRILVEFLKENQVAAEAHFALNIGQLLSFPMIGFGIYLMVRATKMGPVSSPARARSA